jgi:hypothetical protein
MIGQIGTRGCIRLRDGLEVSNSTRGRVEGDVCNVQIALRLTGLGGRDSDIAADPSSDISDFINVELLEDEPPAAGEYWRKR